MRLLTRHPDTFDILADRIDPARSIYAKYVRNYPEKVRQLCKDLEVRAAIWTVPEEKRFPICEPGKDIEYLIDVELNRVVAWVDESSWWDYVLGRATRFQYSSRPQNYKHVSVLVAAPLREEEILEWRRLCPGAGHIVERGSYRGVASEPRRNGNRVWSQQEQQ